MSFKFSKIRTTSTKLPSTPHQTNNPNQQKNANFLASIWTNPTPHLPPPPPKKKFNEPERLHTHTNTDNNKKTQTKTKIKTENDTDRDERVADALLLFEEGFEVGFGGAHLLHSTGNRRKLRPLLGYRPSLPSFHASTAMTTRSWARGPLLFDCWALGVGCAKLD